MATIKIIDPVSRIEGHMKAEVTIDNGIVTDAKVSGTLFRGFEQVMTGRAPDDAPHITQRICGVCPVSHGQASVLALESVGKYKPSNNARILRNLILGANFIQSHILHFYLLAGPDFVPGPRLAPWSSYWDVDMRPGLEGVMGHLGEALTIRRKSDEMAAIFGGKVPHSATYVAGGMTPQITSEKINRFKTYLAEITNFINRIYIPDVQAVGSIYSDYSSIGQGCGNLIAFGVFEENDGSKFLSSGSLENGQVVSQALNTSNIYEHVAYSLYQDAAPVNPASATTVPQSPKTNAYSWVKSPRYSSEPFEAGALARLKISGRYSGGVSVIDRLAARAEESALVVQAMLRWVNQIDSGAVYDKAYVQAKGTGEGLTEAPRGALGHWIEINQTGLIGNYQVITPTCWNSSPRDNSGVKGPIEQSLIGVKVINESQPVEVLRVIHSFDPCLACAVHVLRPDGKPLVVSRGR
jgi:hydrogenase large subunit